MSGQLRRLGRAIKSSFWFWPTIFIIGGWFGAGLLASIGHHIPKDGTFEFLRSAATTYASPVLTTVAQSTITIVTFVFSTLMVVLTLASSQLSPRILRNTIRQGRTQLVMAIMVGTFAFAMRALILIYAEPSPYVPLILVSVGVAAMLASVFAFLYFIGFMADRVRAPAVIIAVARETQHWIEQIYDFSGRPIDADVRGRIRAEQVSEIAAAKTGAITGIDVPAVVEWARRNDVVVVLDLGLGDQAIQGVTVGRVYGRTQVDTGEIDVALQIERERSVAGDPPWGFRLLVDIANRALSPAVNDPTTAVQVLDALEGLLATLARRSEQAGVVFDDAGAIRLSMPAMSFRAYLNLAVQEIYLYGNGSPQVTQRLAKMLDDLIEVAETDDRKSALREVRKQISVVGPLIELQREDAELVADFG